MFISDPSLIDVIHNVGFLLLWTGSFRFQLAVYAGFAVWAFL